MSDEPTVTAGPTSAGNGKPSLRAMSKQLAELSLNVSERAVEDGADLYVKTVDRIPIQSVREVARLQAYLALRVSGAVARQGRGLVSKL